MQHLCNLSGKAEVFSSVPIFCGCVVKSGTMGLDSANNLPSGCSSTCSSTSVTRSLLLVLLAGGGTNSLPSKLVAVQDDL